MIRDRFSRNWETVPNTCDVYLTGEYGLQAPGSPLWLGGQRVCPTCAAGIPYQYHFSFYWGTWSRVLLVNYRDTSLPQTVVEVNLTPTNPMTSPLWEKEVAPIILRSHGTSWERGEGETVLPKHVIDMMREKVGDKVTNILLLEDLWSRIDPILLEKHMIGGGVPLERCQLTR